jgi:hypothetical protein
VKKGDPRVEEGKETLQKVASLPEEPVGWVIFDQKFDRAYIPRIWTEKEGQRELAELLRYCSKDSEWRRRLVLRPQESRVKLRPKDP